MITRRGFLKTILAILPAVALSSHKFPTIEKRKPYIEVGEIVSHIGSSPSPFKGNGRVIEVLAWNGSCYPVRLDLCGYYPKKECTVPDSDLANLLTEVPKGFWRDTENRRLYPNVHTYVRMQRYGETVEEAIKQLNMFHTEEWIIKYGNAWKMVA